MKVLLDHNIPKPLRLLLTGHLVLTAAQMGWNLLENGDLLRAGERDFDVFVTSDEDFDRHAGDVHRRIAIVKLPTNHWPSIRAAYESIAAAVEASVPGSFLSVEVAQLPRRRRKP